MEYRPDKWVVLKMTDDGEVTYKVLAGWSGSYLYGQSWKLNSGITEVKDDGNFYLIYGYTGSVYKCHKKSYGFNMVTSGIYETFKKRVADVDNADIELLEEKDFINLYFPC